MTAKSFGDTEVVQPGASVRGFLFVAWPRDMYRNGINEQLRDGVSLVQFSADSCSLPVENQYPYLHLK